ncbi:S1 family peptidase [Streptomyces fuscigenes]|uniref:S1 family peptidase n=1 Tax=Streptomyces fuscigenes TaxID=1528880 RepID=UPI001F39585D|nr:S1 family peptidase [Streptomyces fuscigenes]MCF3963970.1 S1 family peptidase [Streptomyces fuscigenes]
MKNGQHRRMSRKRAAVAGGAVIALAVAGITFQTANASEPAPGPTVRVLTPMAAGKLSSSLVKDLGSDDAAGSYYDAKTKSLVVNVLNGDAADTVRRAGGRAKVVAHSLSELRAATKTLSGTASSVGGTSWAIDPVTNKVVVTADRTVRGDALAKLTGAVKDLGGKAQLKRSAGQFKPFIAGGDAIEGSGGRCSLGFNVVKEGQPYFLTAGHCTQAISDWTDAQGNELGSNAGSDFPGHDYGLVKYASSGTAHPSEVDLYDGTTQKITGAGAATVGMNVTRSGSTSHVHDGTVTGLDATVNYGNGDVVNGLIQTDVCAEPGDSGGSLFSGSTAVGLTSGGSGDCTSGGETFFQPVPAALSAFGAEIG